MHKDSNVSKQQENELFEISMPAACSRVLIPCTLTNNNNNDNNNYNKTVFKYDHVVNKEKSRQFLVFQMLT